MRQLADESPEGIGAGGHMKLGAQPRPGCATECAPYMLQDWGPAHRALRRGLDDLGQACGACLNGAGGVEASTAADAPDQAYGSIP
jgi:hypothetical protein